MLYYIRPDGGTSPPNTSPKKKRFVGCCERGLAFISWHVSLCYWFMCMFLCYASLLCLCCERGLAVYLLLAGVYVCMYVRMYVCMYVCIYIYIYIHIHKNTYTYTYIHTYICMCICVYIYIYI